MQEKLSKIYDLIQEKGIRKDSFFVFLNILDKNLQNFFEKKLDKKTFENLFYRQFFMMLNHNKKEQFLESFLNLLKYKNEIIFLCEKFHFELIFRDFQAGEQIFRIEIFDILLYHYEKYKNLLENNNFENGVQRLLKIPIFQIFDGEKFVKFDLVFYIFDKYIDISDCSNGFIFSIYFEEKEVYRSSIFLGYNKILISSIQGFSIVKEGNYFGKFYKILLFIILEISKKLEKNILGFSNKNHPCKFHTVGKGFSGDYDNIFENIGMKKKNESYYFGESFDLKIKNLNLIIKGNIEQNLDIFLGFLK